jgi:hypothetical protein
MSEELEQLKQLGKEFDAQLKCNPPRASCDVFEAFLLELGIDPDSFSGDTWWEYLRGKGLIDDEIVDYLAGAAEWQPIT